MGETNNKRIERAQDTLEKKIQEVHEIKESLKTACGKAKQDLIQQLKSIKSYCSTSSKKKRYYDLNYTSQDKTLTGPAHEMYKVVVGDINEALGLQRDGKKIQSHITRGCRQRKESVI